MKTTSWCGIAALIALLAYGVAAEDPLGGLTRRRSADDETRITSDRLEFDYKDYVALFEGNVRVVDPQFELTADKMLVFFERTNDVRRVDAIGNVHVVSLDRTARCGRATYTRANGSILLQEQPVVTKGPHTLRGEVIRIWLADNRVEVDGAVQLEGSAGSR